MSPNFTEKIDDHLSVSLKLEGFLLERKKARSSLSIGWAVQSLILMLLNFF